MAKTVPIEVKFTRYEKVDLPLSSATPAAIRLIQMAYGLPCNQGLFIEEGNLVMNEEVHGGQHSWMQKETIRKATGEDVVALSVINKLKEFERNEG